MLHFMYNLKSQSIPKLYLLVDLTNTDTQKSNITFLLGIQTVPSPSIHNFAIFLFGGFSLADHLGFILNPFVLNEL